MSTPRRVSGIVVMALSVAMAFLSVAGVVATWQLSSALSVGFDRMYGTVDSALDTADSGLGLIESRVDDARSRVDGLDDLVVDVGEYLLEQPLLLRALAERLDMDVIAEGLDLASDGIDAGLKEVQSALGDQRARVEAERAEIRALQDRTQRWLTLVAVISTLSLGWILLSQATMFMFGLSFYRGENMFDRWLADHSRGELV